MVPFDPALRFLEYHLGFETRSKSDLVSMREPWWCVFESPVGEHAIRVSPPTLFWGYYPYHHPKALYLHEVAHLYVRPPWELTPEHSMEMVAMFAWELAVSKNLVERGLWEPRDLKESVSFHEFLGYRDPFGTRQPSMVEPGEQRPEAPPEVHAKDV